MPTKKIADVPRISKLCRDPEHRPPTMQVFEPGVYEHECPSCHEKTTFVVHENFTL